MKTYPEMFQDSIDMTDGSTTITERDYKAIQLDAYRAGMLRAAEIAGESKGPVISTPMRSAADYQCAAILAKSAILTAANNLKPEDLK